MTAFGLLCCYIVGLIWGYIIGKESLAHIPQKRDLDDFIHYPCTTHMRYASQFIKEGRMDDAYSECCYALKKAGFTFREEDLNHWKEVERRIQTERGNL